MLRLLASPTLAAVVFLRPSAAVLVRRRGRGRVPLQHESSVCTGRMRGSAVAFGSAAARGIHCALRCGRRSWLLGADNWSAAILDIDQCMALGWRNMRS